MARETMTISGRTFEVYHVKPDEYWDSPNRCMLADCYDRPSSKKIDIFNDWDNWARDTQEVSGMGVTSFNTFSFTLRADYNLDVRTLLAEGEFVITKSHNKLYLFD